MTKYAEKALITILLLTVTICSWSCSGNQQSLPTNTSATAQPSVNSGPPRYEGYLDIASCEGIHGWVWNQNQSDAPVKVEIYDSNNLLITMDANVLRDNLVSAGKGDGKHAFTYVLPPFLKDGKLHSIRTRVAGTDFELGNSPKTINCTVQTASQ